MMRSVGGLAVALALCCTPAGAGAEAPPAIYEIGSGGSPRRLVGGVAALGFALSRDGSKVAFFRGYQEGASVWVVNRNGTGERGSSRAREPIASWLTSQLSGLPPVTPLPTRRSNRVLPAWKYVKPPTSSSPTCETGAPERELRRRGVALVREGRRMVGSRQRARSVRRARVDLLHTCRRWGCCPADRGRAGRPRGAGHPTASESRSRVRGGSPLGVVNLRTCSVRVLADPASSIDGAPTWSPDSRRIGYATAAGELFTIRTSGGRPRRRALR